MAKELFSMGSLEKDFQEILGWILLEAETESSISTQGLFGRWSQEAKEGARHVTCYGQLKPIGDILGDGEERMSVLFYLKKKEDEILFCQILIIVWELCPAVLTFQYFWAVPHIA